MRIASISLVKDEADILEGFVRHNLHFVDRMHIIDDRSTDNTPEILRRLAEENPAVRIVDDGWTGAFLQGRRTTDVMRRIMADEDWDVVVALDGDELICAPDRAVFEADLAAIPSGMAGAFSEIRYFATAQDDASIADPLARVRSAISMGPDHKFKSIVTRRLLAEPTLAFDEGNHSLLTHGIEVPAKTLPRVSLAHFAVRSADQIAVKCLKHYVGWRSRADYKNGFARGPIAGAHALVSEPQFALGPGSAVIPAYCENYPLHAAIERPFVERRGALKWPELAVSPPYAQMLGLLDQLIERAAAGDEIVRAAGREGCGSEAMARLVAERNDMRCELDRLRSSTTALAKEYWKTMTFRMRKSLRKRRHGR